MSTHAVVDDWLREGRPEPTPASVLRHLESCTTCARALSDIERVRGWFEGAEDFVPPETVGAIRFHLQAAARQAPRRPLAPARRNGPLPSGLAWLAVAATLLCVALAVARFYPQRPSANVERSAFASVEPLGASVRRAASAPDEIYVMDDGAARFSVTRVPAGQRVIVQVGADRVIVRGTRFRVDAAGGRLVAVSVQHGMVLLELSGREPIELAAGQAFRMQQRPAEDAAAPIEVARPKTPPLNAAPPERASARRPGRSRHEPRLEESIATPAREHRAASQTDDVARTPLDRGSVTSDAAFGAAWALYRAGRYDAASLAFDNLMQKELGPRRSDVLFWSAQAHGSAGRPERAAALYRELLREYPNAWRAAEARAGLMRLNDAARKKPSGTLSTGQSR